ncbi:telomere length regulation protein [Coniothyrium glycines]
MITRRPLLCAASAAVSAPKTCVRHLQHSIPMRPVPKPIPFIPDHTSFLSAIGRGLSAHATKIPSWEALFTLTSPQLKELGVEPARSRRYLLDWREKFRNGEYGIGGDCQHVTDGVAELKIVEAIVPPNPQLGNTISPRSAKATATHDPGTRRFVANVPAGAAAPVEPVDTLPAVRGFIVKGAKNIVGSYVEHIKGTGGLRARIRLQEGIWEVRRGHKVDGGERRKAEVRAKRRAAENRELREKAK